MNPLFRPRSVLSGRGRGVSGRTLCLTVLALLMSHSAAQDTPPDPSADPAADSVTEKPFYIRRYKIKGASKLKPVDVEGAVYPFMGPACFISHVNQACEALQKTYHDAGYTLVRVTWPPQDGKNGVITLEVSEGKVGRLRVKGAKFFLPDKIKNQVPSAAEGEVLNFNRFKAEILALNRHPDRQVTPDVRPGIDPGTWDVDLNVKDKNPLHGSVELNNRYSPDTTELRVNGGLSYSNLWQAGHTLGFNFQVAPERLEDAAVFSGYYVMPLNDSTSLMLTGTKQDSDINTLGGSSVGGRGYVLGARLNFTLPTGPPFAEKPSYFHTLSAGFDFKHFDEDVTFGGETQATPIEYFPFSLNYGGTWLGKTHSTDINAGLTAGLRGLGSDAYEFDNKRYLAGGNFLAVRGDLAHTHDLPGGMEIFAKVQGQLASRPLINSEQFSGGGLGTARGYLESTVLGDNALAGSLELRSPSLINRSKPADPASQGSLADIPAPRKDEWRFYLFADAATLTLNDPLPGQTDQDSLVSVGAGSRISLRDHFHASLDAGLPLRDAGVVQDGDWLVTFRLWTDF